MDKRFRNSNFLLKHTNIRKQNIRMGEGLGRGAEEALMEIFNEVVVINAEKPLKDALNEVGIINTTTDASKKNMEVIVLPEIIDIFWVGSTEYDCNFILSASGLFLTRKERLYMLILLMLWVRLITLPLFPQLG